jgi:SAM-dependent methyltransferase
MNNCSSIHNYKTKRENRQMDDFESATIIVCMTPNPFKAILVDAYNRYAQERDGHLTESWKMEERATFLEILKQEHKQSLLEIGAGPGKDSKFFHDNRLDVTCIDLSPEMVRLCMQKGLKAHLMDVTDLTFASNSFDAVYALNSFLHIPEAEFSMAMENVKKVLKPSGLFYLGVYGGYDFEGIWEEDSYEPKRFFSMRTDEHIQELASQHFELMSFKSMEVETDQSHFQSLILRKTDS